MKDVTQIERGKTISFFNELEIETRTMLVTSISFLIRLPQRRKNYPQVVSFFSELEIRKPCSKTTVSFFNEVVAETQKLSSKPLFHFLTRLPQRRKTILETSVSFFKEDSFCVSVATSLKNETEVSRGLVCVPSGVANFVSGLIRKCGHKPISLDPPGSRTKQDRIILFP
jgi:hypothetical protein